MNDRDEIKMTLFECIFIYVKVVITLTVGAVPHSSCEQSVRYTFFAKVHEVTKHKEIAIYSPRFSVA